MESRKSSGYSTQGLYLLIATMLLVQAVFEVLYVRKVLLIGGTAVPLTPY